MDEPACQGAFATVVHRRVAAAVEHHVVLVGHGCGEVELVFALKNDARAVDWMFLHDRPLLRGEPPGLGQDIQWDAGLPDVVQESGHADFPGVIR